MKKFVPFIIALPMVLGACEREVGVEYKTAHSDSFVVQYWSFDELEVSCIPPDTTLNIYLKSSPGNPKLYYGVLSEDARLRRMYREKCAEHGDEGFPFEFRYGPDLTPNSFPDKDFAAIEVVSDADFDEQHPAGSRVDDLLLFCSASPWRFIRSGYTEKANWSDADILQAVHRYYGNVIPYDAQNTGYYHPVYGKASEMGPGRFDPAWRGRRGCRSNGADRGYDIYEEAR